MGMVLIYGLLMIIIILTIAIVLFFYSRKKKSKIGMTISILLFSVVALVLLTNTIDELTTTKADVKKDLKYIDIELNDDFKIVSNNVTGMPERFQETKLEISSKDKERIIEKIQNAANYKELLTEETLMNDVASDEGNVISNVRYPEHYLRKVFTEIDNFPTIISISINNESNVIEYQRIEN